MRIVKLPKTPDKSIAALQNIGFNESEARVYVALLQRQPLTGYEVAKAADIQRANVYRVLEKLQQRGAVTRVDNPEGTRYAAVPYEELLEKLLRRYEQGIAESEEALADLAPAPETAPLVQFEGYRNLIETAQQLLESADEQVLLVVWPEEAQALVDFVEASDRRGVNLMTLCMAGCRQVCPYCRGKVCRYPFGLEEKQRWLLLVADGNSALAGFVQPPADAVALHTRQPFPVRMAMSYIRHSIALAALLTDLNLSLDERMSPGTREALAELMPPGSGDDWLRHMRQLLRERKAH
jgi:HTH-type transcriptional regulator, sugar sensing transcriptional regulator